MFAKISFLLLTLFCLSPEVHCFLLFISLSTWWVWTQSLPCQCVPRSFHAGVVIGHTIGLGDKSPALFLALLVTEHPRLCGTRCVSSCADISLGVWDPFLLTYLPPSRLCRACCYSSLYHQHLAQCPLHTRISIKVFRILNIFTGWPKHSFEVFPSHVMEKPRTNVLANPMPWLTNQETQGRWDSS